MDTHLTLSEWGHGRKNRGKSFGNNSRKVQQDVGREPWSPDSTGDSTLVS